jgi:prephenate dehydrogenase
MPVQLAILGLGQIGASIGLALDQHKDTILRVGYDPDGHRLQQAEKNGAIDRATTKMGSAVQEADVVLLALPIGQIRESLQEISKYLHPGTVVMETSLAKQAVMDWMIELLPPGCHAIGLLPVINPAYLTSIGVGRDAVRDDLFQNGRMGIVFPVDTPAEVIKVAVDLTHFLGARPLFLDLLELDGLIASTEVLPQLLTAAFLDATLDQPGWRDAQKVAGRSYAVLTEPIELAGEPADFAEVAIDHRANLPRLLDNLIRSLVSFEEDLSQGDKEAIEGRVAKVKQGREEWLQLRFSDKEEPTGLPSIESPTASEIFGQQIGLGRRKKRK